PPREAARRGETAGQWRAADGPGGARHRRRHPQRRGLNRRTGSARTTHPPRPPPLTFPPPFPQVLPDSLDGRIEWTRERRWHRPPGGPETPPRPAAGVREWRRERTARDCPMR